MADVDDTLAEWSSTTNSNKPTGATTVGTGWDDNLREIQGVIVRGLSHKGADIASAATTDLGAVDGLFHDITGTTTITGFGTIRAGIWKVLKFEGALTLTHNATSLIIPGGANITTADGDMLMATSEGSGNWRVNWYVRSNGRPVIGTVLDTVFRIQDDGDTTKQIAFQGSAITTGTTRTITVPDQDFTLNTTGALAAGRNIAARTNSVTPDTKFDITADEVILKDTNNNIFVARSVNVTVNFAGTGANGIDTGTQQASTWYYGWVIAKADGTIAGLGSASSSAPTMPSGYVYKALVTAARSDGSVHFLKYRQFGNRAHFEAAQNALNSSAINASETTVSLSSFTPPIAEESILQIYGHASSSVDVLSSTATVRVISGSIRNAAQIQASGADASPFGFECSVPNVSQQVFVAFSNVTNFNTSLFKVDVLGFKLPCGGE